MSAMTTPQPRRADAIRGRDSLDRKIPRTACCLPLMLTKMANWGIPVQEIPGEYWTLDVDDDGYTIATVACPCGHSPQIHMAASRMCRGDWCRADEERGIPEPSYDECSRSYIFTGDSVWVAGSPARRQVQTAAPS